MAKNKWEISAFGWNKISGTYCVCSKCDGKTKIHYIGSAKDIGKRLANNNHPYRVLLLNGVQVFIKFKETEDYLTFEKSLIARLNPSINKIKYNGFKVF